MRTVSRLAGLTVHGFGAVATHDPTYNSKLDSRPLLEATPIESEAGEPDDHVGSIKSDAR